MRIFLCSGLGALQEFFGIIHLLRAPLLISVLAFLMLSAPAQVLELYLLLARDWIRYWPQAVLAIVSLGALSVFITYIARELTRPAALDVDHTAPFVQRPITRWSPVFLGLLPLVGAAVGLNAALTSATTPEMRYATSIFEKFRTQAEFDQMFKTVTDYYTNREPESMWAWKEVESTHADLSTGLKTTAPAAIMETKQNADLLRLKIYLAIAACIALAVLSVVGLSHRVLKPATRGDVLGAKAFHPAVRYGFYVASLGLVALFAAQSLNVGRVHVFDFTAIPRALGTLFLVNLCLIFLAFHCSLLTRIHERYRIPVLTLLVMAALAISAVDLNNNHAVRLVDVTRDDLEKRGAPGKPAGPPAAPTIWNAFAAWLATRPADYVAKFQGREYPIYIVAAQGGGMYAANLSGLFLARLYDRCPVMRHHVFAISGVSGGSVGAGFFAALLNDAKTAPLADTCHLDVVPEGDGKGPIERKIEILLRQDYLAPVSASFLFPDLAQRFIPVPIEALDRARAFEAGIEQAWQTHIAPGANPLREPISRHWRPDGPAPMLLLNATVAETGRQTALAPALLGPEATNSKNARTQNLQSLHETVALGFDKDVPLSTAMSLSARFPVVMPAGLVKGAHARFHLVDGGYFENSAVEAAMALGHKVRETMNAEGSTTKPCEQAVCQCIRDYDKPGFACSVRLIALSDYAFYKKRSLRKRDDSAGFNEALSPLRAMLNSRVARGDYAVSQLDPAIRIHPIVLNHALYQLPLGWQLSTEVQAIISAQIGDPTRCKTGNPLDFVAMVERAMNALSGTDDGVYIATGILNNLNRNHCMYRDSGMLKIGETLNRTANPAAAP